jgi:hypothetical protein
LSTTVPLFPRSFAREAIAILILWLT